MRSIIRHALLVAASAGLLAGTALADDRPDLTVAVNTLPGSLESIGEQGNVAVRITCTLFDSLIRRDFLSDGPGTSAELVPGLAQSWTRVDDRTMDFTLRQGVRFHNGDELTSDDVSFSLVVGRGKGKNPIFGEGKSCMNSISHVVPTGRTSVRMMSGEPEILMEQRIAQAMRLRRGCSRAEAEAEAIRLLGRVGLPDMARRAREYPHQFSGGNRQRAMIALKIAGRLRLLIADEATTALDVTLQAQILDLIADLLAGMGMGVIFVTHDLGVVAQTADRVAVMYAGRIMEVAPARDLFAAPRHPYAHGLMGASPRIDRDLAALTVIDGTVSALDVSIQAQIVNLLVDLQRRLGLAYVFVSHDLGVVRHVADRVHVMYLGQVVEHAPKAALFAAPRHPVRPRCSTRYPHPIRACAAAAPPWPAIHPARTIRPPAAGSIRAASMCSRAAAPRCPRCAASAHTRSPSTAPKSCHRRRPSLPCRNGNSPDAVSGCQTVARGADAASGHHLSVRGAADFRRSDRHPARRRCLRRGAGVLSREMGARPDALAAIRRVSARAFDRRFRPVAAQQPARVGNGVRTRALPAPR